MAPVAARFHGDPTARLQTVGITGTNGKTTTAFLVRALLEAAGRQAGLLGTVKSVIGGVEHEVLRTTPEAIDLQRTFAEMLDAGDRACVMEVSSHALKLHRADAIHFAAAVFTNLTQDHLDFHETMEEYYGAKRLLFTDLSPAHAVVNVDDPYGARLAAELGGAAITFALEHDASYRAGAVQTGLDGSHFAVTAPDGVFELTSPLTGRFNVSNVLGAFATARALGVDADTAIEAIASAGQVPGRFQAVNEGQDYAVLVDYAHTPDSLENVLRRPRAASPTGGCTWSSAAAGTATAASARRWGRSPRASPTASSSPLTTPGPRTPLRSSTRSSSAAARTWSTRWTGGSPSIRPSPPRGPGDVVVIAGKGHEQGQEFEGGRKIPFDDVTVVRESLQRALAGSR